MAAILIATDDPDRLRELRSHLRGDHAVDEARDRGTCLDRHGDKRYDFIFLDLSVLEVGLAAGPEACGAALGPFRARFPTAQLVILAPSERTRQAVSAVRAGATDYLTFPVDTIELDHVIESLEDKMRIEQELDYHRDRFWKDGADEIVRTSNPLMQDVYDKVRSVAGTRMTVLLTGETGTGKGVLARIIHAHSNRAENQFISLHCGAIPDTLVESELFGHEKGAFTGADRRKLGCFELAHNGTIFLDEVGTVTPSVQVKLLRVLQEGTVQRVGGEEPIETDARVIAATNEDLRSMTETGSFRSDLYYRLCVFPIHVPPLRERSDDIPQLIDMFMGRYRDVHGKDIAGVDDAVMEALQRYPWPGNIRELEHVLERAFILEETGVLRAGSFPHEITGGRTSMSVDLTGTLAEARRKAIDGTERRYLEALLRSSRGRIKDAADVAGITPRQLHNLLVKHGLRKESYKA